jgi:hypothetical protein
MSMDAKANILNKQFAAGASGRQSGYDCLPLLPVPKQCRGQEMVEFAIIFPVLVLFLFGVIDLGRMFHALTVITNAARAGARYGTAEACTVTSGVFGCDTAAIIQETRAEALGSGIDLSASPVDVFAPAARGGALRVNVRFRFDFWISGVLPVPGLTLNRFAVMMVP